MNRRELEAAEGKYERILKEEKEQGGLEIISRSSWLAEIEKRRKCSS